MENEFHFLVSGPKNLEGPFRRTFEEFPEFTLEPVGESALLDVSRHTAQVEKDTQWISEKEQLGIIVNNVVQAIVNEDSAALENFVELYKAQKNCISNWEDFSHKTLSLQEFILGAVMVFQKTVEGYGKESKSPKFITHRYGRSRAVYRKPPGVPLNPRNVRLIIGKNGLDGQSPRSIEELAKEEEIRKQSVKVVEEELVKAIFKSLFKSRKGEQSLSFVPTFHRTLE